LEELLGRVLGALKRLRPQQQNKGAGSVQVGKAGGAVKVVNVNRHDVTHQNGQVHLHFYAAPAPATEPISMAPPPAPTSADTPRLQRVVVHQLTDVHREVLTLMDPLSKRRRLSVLDFMGREFGTRMVKELDANEAHRVRLYVRQIHANSRRGNEHDFL
jgi:hypothetical protein